MDISAYLYTFISLSITIGVGGLLNHIHKLLRIRNNVNWHWLPLLWALVVFLTLFHIWFGLYDHLNNKLTETGGGVIIFLLPVIFILLLSKVVLPDNPSKEGVNLKEWYFKQKNYMTILLILNLISFSFVKYFEKFDSLTPVDEFNYILITITLGLYLILFFTKRIWIHTIVATFILLIAVFLLVEQRFI